VGVSSLFLEGDALLVILAINQPSLFTSWSFANVISDISLDLISFQSWHASKVSRSANYRSHVLAKWAASNQVFGSILIGSPFSLPSGSGVAKILPCSPFSYSIWKKKKKKNFTLYSPYTPSTP
jgi:hypothetical protein